MAKLLKIFQGGKKAPHPPRPDYSGGKKRSLTSPADDEFDTFTHDMPHSASEHHDIHNGAHFRNMGDTPHAIATGDRFRHPSQGSQDTGVENGRSWANGHREGTGEESRSPTAKIRPIIAEDYSDPKDVIRVAQESGLVIPPESPEFTPGRIPEDDYSVPYDAQKILEQIRQAEDQKQLGNSHHSQGGLGSGSSSEINGFQSVQSLKQSPSSHQYEEPPVSFTSSTPSPTVPSPTDTMGICESNQYPDSNNSSQIPSHHSSDEVLRESSSSPSSENSDYNSGVRMARSYSAHHRLQTPQNDARPQGEYDNPWEWQLKKPGLPPTHGSPQTNMGHRDNVEPLDSPRFRSRSDARHMRGRTSPDVDPRSVRGRTSPESDTRPQDEYDQPWEWIQKKKNMAQSVKERGRDNVSSNHSTPESVRRGNTKKATRELRLEIKTLRETAGEAINVTVPLHDQRWYHGKLSRTDAEKKLKTHKECSYLIRQSESAAKDYSLSLKSMKGFMHMKIIQHPEGFILGEFSKPFRNIPEMISYYTTHKLNIKGAAHMALLHPVYIEML